MAFDYWNPNSGEAPWWAQEWNANAFRQLQQQAGFDPGIGSAARLKDGGDTLQRQDFFNYLANNGMQLGHQLEGRQGQYQVLDAQGNPVANEGFDPGGMMDMALPVLMAVGANYLVGGGGLGAGLEGAAAGAEAGAGLGATEAGIGTLGAGGTSIVPIGASMSPGALGITALGPAVGTGAELAALSAALPTLGSSAASIAAPGLLDTLKNAGNSVKDFVSPVSNLVGGAGNLAAIVGGALGAANSGGTNTATTQSQIDPRMQQYLYGTGYGDTNSLLGAAQAQFKANPTGINPTMQQGLDMSKAALSDPAYSQAFQQMRSVGTGLLGNQAAGNPFTTGQGPTMQAGGMGGLLGNTNLQGLMARGRGLLS